MKKPFLYALIALGVIVLLGTKGKDLTANLMHYSQIRETYLPNVFEASIRFNIPAERILAMIAVESSGNAHATGAIGERGLMQLTWNAAREAWDQFGLPYSWDDMYEPRANINTGTSYLRLLVNRLGTLDRGTMAYNAGSNEEAGGIYLDKVLIAEKEFQLIALSLT